MTWDNELFQRQICTFELLRDNQLSHSTIDYSRAKMNILRPWESIITLDNWLSAHEFLEKSNFKDSYSFKTYIIFLNLFEAQKFTMIP